MNPLPLDLNIDFTGSISKNRVFQCERIIMVMEVIGR